MVKHKIILLCKIRDLQDEERDKERRFFYYTQKDYCNIQIFLLIIKISNPEIELHRFTQLSQTITLE